MRTLIMLGDNEAARVSASSHEADDVSLDRGVVTFRPTAARRWCAAWMATSDRCATARRSWSTASSSTSLSWGSAWRLCRLVLLAPPLTPRA